MKIMVMEKTVIIVGFCFSLMACSAVVPVNPLTPTTVGDVNTAVSVTATAVANISNASSSLLSKAASGACAGQALANAATDMFNQLGQVAAAQKSANVSNVLGQGCTWGSVL